MQQVRCAVCKSIFCCHECRSRHELNAHNPNDVQAERNRLLCGLCQGYPTMEFQSRNDFALIMHLCQTHLPLHCKKCLTVNMRRAILFFSLLSFLIRFILNFICVLLRNVIDRRCDGTKSHFTCANRKMSQLVNVLSSNIIVVVHIHSNSIRLEISLPPANAHI